MKHCGSGGRQRKSAPETIRKILTIAGSDCSGGAGIQADIKTITAHKMYAMSVITALTAQNTTGVAGIEEASPEFVALQLDSVFQDIFPDAVKIGMVANAEIIKIIGAKLRQYGAKNIVVDPVMVSTSGSRLFAGDASQALVDALFPLADVITPNLPEAEALTQAAPIKSRVEMRAAAKALSRYVKGGILVKGGHLPDSADDVLWAHGQAVWYPGARVDNSNTHGTGCTLSSAIACQLADGCILEAAVRNAKRYINDALKAGMNLGKGRGPLNHCCRM